MSKLEKAIPDHLRVKRTQPLSVAEDFEPQHPSHSARFHPAVLDTPIVYVGVQHKPNVNADHVIAKFETAFRSKNGPKHWDRAIFLDDMGYENTICVGYWDSLKAFENWQKNRPKDWWHEDVCINGNIGCFLECYTPSIWDAETTFSHPYAEGYSKIADAMSRETDTHEYWGAARDRIPRGQTEELLSRGAPQIMGDKPSKTFGQHIVVAPHENLCLLRSGQDWTQTSDEETEFYLTKVKPFLDKGMIEIRDDEGVIGCHFNRYMTLCEKGKPIKKSYSLSGWRSLSELEAWVKTDTHLAIWGAGIRHYKAAGDNARLRLYHEMFVLKAKDQRFEYFNCHRATGMLKSALMSAKK